jgi:hypothetical protein
LAQELLEPLRVRRRGRRRAGRATVSRSASRGPTARGQTWYFEVSGAFTSTRAGLRRTDTLWKALGKAAVLHASHPDIPLVLITTDAPVAGSAGEKALKALRHHRRPGGFGAVFDVIEMESADDRSRLGRYAAKGPGAAEGHEPGR